jgi:hypothetical protein
MNVVYPISSKDNYVANDMVDFLLTFDNREIVQNSIRITGLLKVNNTGSFLTGQLSSATDVQFDSTVGIAGAFQGITCSCDNLGIVENQIEHPRYVKAKAVATTTPQLLLTDCQNTTELKNSNNVFSRCILGGNGQPANDGNKIPFSMKPDIAFNKSSNNIPFSKTGSCKISLRLATDAQFLYGANAAAITYKLYDLRVEYMTQPQSGVKDLVFETIHVIKNTAESNNTSIATRVPATVQSVSMVFHIDSQLNNAIYNHLRLDTPPDVQSIEFNFNDSTTQYYTYSLKTQEEILYNYQMSWGVPPMSKGGISLPRLDALDSYGVGMYLGGYIDMSKSKFGVNIKSNITSPLKYAVFMIFRGIVKV